MTADDQLAELLGWLRPAWHADALCKEYPELFPETGQSAAPAVAVCRRLSRAT